MDEIKSIVIDQGGLDLKFSIEPREHFIILSISRTHDNIPQTQEIFFTRDNFDKLVSFFKELK